MSGWGVVRLGGESAGLVTGRVGNPPLRLGTLLRAARGVVGHHAPAVFVAGEDVGGEGAEVGGVPLDHAGDALDAGAWRRWRQSQDGLSFRYAEEAS